MPRISATNDVITLINVFTVEPANQQRLVKLLTEATEISVRQAPGFVSASLHRSTDSTSQQPPTRFNPESGPFL